MVVRLRLSMHGPRNNKFFRLVVMNARQRRDARPIEMLGEYRPQVTHKTDPPVKTVQWSVDRIKYWLGVGALPSKSAVRLLTQGGIIPLDSKYHNPSSSPSTKQSPSQVASQTES